MKRHSKYETDGERRQARKIYQAEYYRSHKENARQRYRKYYEQNRRSTRQPGVGSSRRMGPQYDHGLGKSGREKTHRLWNHSALQKLPPGQFERAANHILSGDWEYVGAR